MIATALRNRWVLRGLSIVMVLSAWEYVGARLSPIFLSTPSKIVFALVTLSTNGQLFQALWVSIAGIMIGFVAALLVGIPLGLFMGRVRAVEYFLDPWVSALFVTPRVALIPIILIWFGIGFEAQVVIVFLSALFPAIINTYAGVRNISGNLIDTGKAFGANERQLLFEIILPASVPFIMTGVRLSIGQAVIGLIVGQMFLALSGLGRLLVVNGDRFKTDYVFAIIIVIGLLGVTLTEAAKAAERRFSHWKETERAFG